LEINIKLFLEKLKELKSICLDSAVLIYHLEKIKPYDNLTRLLLDKIASGYIFCSISTLTVTELLTKLYRLKDFHQISVFEEFINSLPNSKIHPVTYDIAKFAASLRADYNIRTPDSILISTAYIMKSDYFITNDISLKKVNLEGLDMIILDDYL